MIRAGNDRSEAASRSPLVLEYRVHDFVGPFTLDELVLAKVRLAPHPEALEDPLRSGVATVDASDDPMRVEPLER